MTTFGFFDRTTRGRLIVTGRDRVDLLHRLATNSLVGLKRGEGRETCFCTPKGRLIDWTVVLDREDDLLLLSGNPERLLGHIIQYTITEDVTVRNYMAIELVVCGPGAAAELGVELEPWTFTEKRLGGVTVQIARIEPLWGDAYAVLAPDAVALRQSLAERGRQLDVDEVDHLRVQATMPAFPHEINERHNPWEANLESAISLKKGCYVGQEVIARLHTYEKVQRRLVRVELFEEFPPGTPLRIDQQDVGELTTIAGRAALAYMSKDHCAPGTAFDGGRVALSPAE